MNAAVETALTTGAKRQVIIRPSRGLFDLDLASVWQYRELLHTLMMRDIQVLYKQAALGAAWAIIQPIFAVTVFTIVFGNFAKMPSDGIPYPIFAFAAVLPWTYFAEATRRAATGPGPHRGPPTAEALPRPPPAGPRELHPSESRGARAPGSCADPTRLDPQLPPEGGGE